MKVDRPQWALTDYAPDDSMSEMVIGMEPHELSIMVRHEMATMAERMSDSESIVLAGLNREVVPSSMMVFEPGVALMPMTGRGGRTISLAAMDPSLGAISKTVMEMESRVIRMSTIDLNSGVLVGFGGRGAGDHGAPQRQDRNGSQERAPEQ